jgi:hypothetical protein
VPFAAYAAEHRAGYDVTYSGGSLPTVEGGQSIQMFLDADAVHLRQGWRKKAYRFQKTDKLADLATIPISSITEVSYGLEVHHRIGQAVALAFVSFGAGMLVAFSKEKKHYIGIVWDDAGKKGGLVLQADKNEYRGLVAALEGLTGKKAVDADTATK